MYFLQNYANLFYFYELFVINTPYVPQCTPTSEKKLLELLLLFKQNNLFALN